MKKQFIFVIGGIIILLILAGLIYYFWPQISSLFNQQQNDNVFVIGEEDDRTEFLKLTDEQIPEDRKDVYYAAVEKLQTAPYDKASCLNLGYTYWYIGEYDYAVKAFDQHLKTDPYDPEALLGMARVRVKEGRYAEAEEYFYDILELFPFYIIAYKELLAVYEEGNWPPNPKFRQEILYALEQEGAEEYEEQLNGFLLEFTELGG